MTREQAIAIIRKEYLCVDRDCDIERSCGKCDLMMPSKEPILQAYDMAIQALQAQADGEYVRKKDVMGCIGQTSLHFELARKLRKLPTVIIPSAEPKWILTSERLPRIGEWVLVTNGKCDGKHCEIMTYHGLKTQIVHRVGEGEYEEQYHEWTSGHGDIQGHHPKAWMPLPKPYEPQESEG